MLDSGKIKENWKIDKLLDYFRRFDLIFSTEDIYNMIIQKPLKNVISNVEGDDVIFKGIEQPKKPIESPPPEKSKEVVSKMAQKAMK